MFTGIIEELGVIKKIKRGSKEYVLEIEASRIIDGVQVGDSVAVNGVCLTATTVRGKKFTVDVMPETAKKTTIDGLKPGDLVNLERALTLAGRLGGHMVAGHIDGVGTLTKKTRQENAIIIEIKATEALTAFLIDRGSIAVDGISLTVIDFGSDFVVVSIIPHTAAATTLGFKERGDTVNLESDLIGKYVYKFMSGISSAQDMSKAKLEGINNRRKETSKKMSLDKLGDLGFL